MSIKTIAKAAAELSRLYEAFDRKAVDLTTTYIKKRLAGKEGVTWEMFPKGKDAFAKATPLLDRIMRHKEAILLSPGYNMCNDVLSKYELTKVPARSLGIDGASGVKHVITIHRPKVGFDPGEKYMILGDQVLKAGYDQMGSVPSPLKGGGFDYSAPRHWLNDTFGPLTEVDADLLKVIKNLQAYA